MTGARRGQRSPWSTPTPDAFKAAIRLLGPRAHSEAELRQKLLRRGHQADEVDAAVRRLRTHGYLDDRAFARALVERRTAGRGETLIAAELAAKGIDRDVAEAALSQFGHAQQVEAARALARRSPDLDASRLAARLARRGFAPEVIDEVVPQG